MMGADANRPPCMALRAVTGGPLRPGGCRLTKRAIEFCGVGPGAHVLDVGCGTGASVGWMIQECGIDATGIDASYAMLSANADSGLPLYQGVAEGLKFANGFFDMVLTECSFSHFEDRRRALSECYRVLKRGGSLVISDLYSRASGTLMTWEDAAQLAEDSGFTITLLEDHTPALKELGIALILQYGSLERFWELGCRDCTKCSLSALAQGRSLGYYLLIAKK